MHAARGAASEGQLLADLASSVCELTEADSCELFLRDGDALVLRGSTRAPEYANRVRLGKGVGLAGSVLKSGEPLFVESGGDARPEFAFFPGVDEQPCEGCAVVPIPGQGSSLGVLMVRRPVAWELSPEFRSRLMDVSRFCGDLIALYHHAFHAGSEATRMGALSEVTRTIASSPYIEEILQLLVNLTAQQFHYVVVTVRLLDEAHGELVLRATQAPAKAYARKRAIRLGESIAGRAMNDVKPVIVSDVQEEADYIGHELAVEQGLRSMICVPLVVQNRAIGVMSCYTDEVRGFEEDEIRALETLAQQAAYSIEHAKLQVRSTLMQEMHHRVKNNLQQVASLLRLQVRQSHYKSLEEAINDCLARILAISSVHDLLSREDLDHVGIRSIAEMLVQHQVGTLVKPGTTVRFEVRGDDVRLNMTQATQVALVLNELIQNAVEHGFETASEGDVHVTVEDGGAEVSLWVSNSGDHLPESFDLAGSSHLGLQIVDSLARALGGRFTLGDVLGWTVAEVKFSRAGME